MMITRILGEYVLTVKTPNSDRIAQIGEMIYSSIGLIQKVYDSDYNLYFSDDKALTRYEVSTYASP